MLNWIWSSMIILGIMVGFLNLMIFGNHDTISNIMQELMNTASLATEIVIGLVGMMCFWLGIAEIMDKTGITKILAKLLTPLFKVIMPEIPNGHPAIGSICLNMAANMLGLDNAATPLGLRAMRELETLNPNKGVASNSEIMFLVINTSSITIFPISVFLYRSKFGAEVPVDVFLPILITTTCSTIAGILAVAFFQKINLFKLPIFIAFGLLLSLLSGCFIWSMFVGANLATQASIFANGAILLFIMSVISYGLYKHLNVYEKFIEGAKLGFKTCIDILPYLVAMLVAVAIFRASGILPWILKQISNIFAYFNIDTTFVDAIPVSVMHSLSGSGSRALMLDIFNNFGVDSLVGRIASVMQGSTETTFYVLAVYFGAVQITRVRHAVTCGIIADLAAMIAAIFVSYVFFANV